MSWMQKLYRTYESILEQGVTDDAEPLTPGRAYHPKRAHRHRD